MIRILGLLAGFLVTGSVLAWPPSATVGCRAYTAEIEVCRDGVIRHGRLIVTEDGCVFLEHLDEPTRRWAVAVLCPPAGPMLGWNERPRPVAVRRAWCRLGGFDVLGEVHTPDAWIKVSRHQLLSAR